MLPGNSVKDGLSNGDPFWKQDGGSSSQIIAIPGREEIGPYSEVPHYRPKMLGLVYTSLHAKDLAHSGDSVNPFNCFYFLKSNIVYSLYHKVWINIPTRTGSVYWKTLLFPASGIYRTSPPAPPSSGSATTRLEVLFKYIQLSNWGLRREACTHLWKFQSQENALHLGRHPWVPLRPGWGLAQPVLMCLCKIFQTMCLFVSFQRVMAVEWSMLKLSNSLLTIPKMCFRASELFFVLLRHLHVIYKRLYSHIGCHMEIRMTSLQSPCFADQANTH